MATALFGYLVFANADFFDKIPQCLNYMISLDDLNDEKPLNKRFNTFGFGNVTFVNNYYQKFELILAIIVLSPIFWFLANVIRHPKLGAPFRSVHKSLTWNFPLQFLTELYLEFCVIFWLNVFGGLSFNNFA